MYQSLCHLLTTAEVPFETGSAEVEARDAASAEGGEAGAATSTALSGAVSKAGEVISGITSGGNDASTEGEDYDPRLVETGGSTGSDPVQALVDEMSKAAQGVPEGLGSEPAPEAAVTESRGTPAKGEHSKNFFEKVATAVGLMPDEEEETQRQA